MDSVVLEQRASLAKAFYDTQQGVSMNSIVLQYQDNIRQTLVKLHSLGYPILSFYIDQYLTYKIAIHHHISVVDSVYILKYISGKFQNTCVQNTTSYEKSENSYLCGNIHLTNVVTMHSAVYLIHHYTIKVPHMFYIRLQFLEIILVGGLRDHECGLYQFVKVWHSSFFPFLSEQHNRIFEFYFCGSHPPFTTVLHGNVVHLEGVFNIKNSYASCKLRYSAIDILVSVSSLFNYLRIIYTALYKKAYMLQSSI